MPGVRRASRGSFLALAAVLVCGAGARYAFLSGAEHAEFDPWRHLQLIENLRRGAGFTLFDGQPYLWYNDLWYRLAALFGPGENARWLSAGLSLASVAGFFGFLLRTEGSLAAAVAGTLPMAAWGPCVAYTATYGSEAFAMFLLVASCCLAACRSGRLAAAAAGALFGAALLSRITFAFTCLLPLPLLGDRTRKALFVGAAAGVLALGWLRNDAVISGHPYLFTWDGIATEREGYGIASTLVPQLHPTVAEATRSLYRQLAVPSPFDLSARGLTALNNAVALALGAAGVLATGRWSLALAAFVPLGYFVGFGREASADFFRHYLAVFPALFVGIAVVSGRLLRAPSGHGRRGRLLAPALVLGFLLTGAAHLRPQAPPPLASVTPPPELLRGARYMVNSGMYHPESLAYRYPDKRFIGIPLELARFEDFSRQFPDYTAIVWRQRSSIQDELLRELVRSGRYRVVGEGSNEAGLRYRVLEKSRSVVNGRQAAESAPAPERAPLTAGGSRAYPTLRGEDATPAAAAAGPGAR